MLSTEGVDFDFFNETVFLQISALPKASTEETTAETLPQSSSDSCDASIPSATLLSPSAKVSMGAEVTDGVTYFSLTISDFSKADVGCYICALQPSGQKTLERAFNVVGKYYFIISPFKLPLKGPPLS